MPSDATIAARLREHGLRVTPQRRVILSVFADGRAGHLTAEETLRRASQKLPELARATVYNALADFVDAGLLTTVEGVGSQLYDANTEAHHHFRCRSCGSLADVHVDGAERLRPDDDRVTVERAQILFEGICGRCARA